MNNFILTAMLVIAGIFLLIIMILVIIECIQITRLRIRKEFEKFIDDEVTNRMKILYYWQDKCDNDIDGKTEEETNLK